MGAPTTLTVIGIIILFLGVFIGWYGFPKLVNNKILESKTLNPRSKMRQMWSHPPLAADFKIYLFNVTNPEEAQKGEKIIINEVGPYFYHEWKEKENLKDDVKSDTVDFNFKNTFIFDEELTLPLTGEEIIVMPHLAMIGMISMTKILKPSALSMINKAIPLLYPEQTNIFMTAMANEIMWTGLDINCTSTEFAAVAICSQIRKNSASMHKISDEHFKFSLFGVKNGTIETNRYTVNRGVQSPMEVGQVIRFNGKSKLDVWPEEECNNISGTDTTIFPPYITIETNLASFSGDICRSVIPDYVQETIYNGVRVYEYTAMLVKPEEKCYCLNPNSCLKPGALDLTNCTGSPIIATLPHFFKSEGYLNDVSGLNPDINKHGIKMYFEPMTGSPLLGYKRMQFNMFLKKESKITLMKTLNDEEKLIPLFWVEEGIALNKTWTDQIKNKLYLPITIVKYVKYLVVAIGVIFFIIAIVVNYNSVKTMEITPNY